MPYMFAALAVILILLLYGITLYNALISLKHNVSRSFSNIEVLLKQRHDELPKLVETCKQYMQYEQTTLERVIQARSAVAQAQQAQDIGALGKAESLLRAGLGQIFALAENYPELKANETFVHLQQRITGLENTIADRRETYNDWVNNLNVRLEQFPDVIVARLFGFKAAQLLQFTEAELADPDLKALFR